MYMPEGETFRISIFGIFWNKTGIYGITGSFSSFFSHQHFQNIPDITVARFSFSIGGSVMRMIYFCWIIQKRFIFFWTRNREFPSLGSSFAPKNTFFPLQPGDRTGMPMTASARPPLPSWKSNGGEGHACQASGSTQ